MDLQGILDRLKKADKSRITLMKNQITSLESRKNAFKSVNAKLLAVKSSALTLSLASTYMKRGANVSSPSVLSASVLDGAAIGKHSVSVQRLATKSSFASEGMKSNTGAINVPTVQTSETGVANTDTAIFLAANEKMKITYGTGKSRKEIEISGGTGGMTLKQVVEAVKTHSANQTGKGGQYIDASAVTGKDGKFHLKFQAADGGKTEESRVMVTKAPKSMKFEAPDLTFSYTVGYGKIKKMKIPADTSLKKLVELINNNKSNGGVTASIINTGTGQHPYKLILTSNKAGEDGRIRVIGNPSQLGLKEQQGSGHIITSNKIISFASPITLRAADNNNKFVFREDSGKGFGSDITAVIPDGVYQKGKDLAAALQKSMNEASKAQGGGFEYSVRYNADLGKLEISQAGNLKKLEMKWDDPKSAGAATSLGFKKETYSISPFSASLNAAFKVGGISYQRSKNAGITDVLDGIGLTLTKIGTATVSVSNQSSSIVNHIKKMVSNLNALVKEIDQNDDFDKKTQKWGSLARTPSIQTAKNQLLGLITSRSSGSGSIKGLHDLGLKVARDGTLSIDENVLKKKVSQDFEGVKKFLLGGEGSTGMADRVNNMLKEFTRSNGLLNSETKAVDTEIATLKEDIKTKSKSIDKRYETMAGQFRVLDRYVQKMKAQQNFMNQIIEAGRARNSKR